MFDNVDNNEQDDEDKDDNDGNDLNQMPGMKQRLVQGKRRFGGKMDGLGFGTSWKIVFRIDLGNQS